MSESSVSFLMLAGGEEFQLQNWDGKFVNPITDQVQDLSISCFNISFKNSASPIELYGRDGLVICQFHIPIKTNSQANVS